MHLLALNLQKPSAINASIYGNFSGPKNHEFVVAKGSSIELLRPDDTGKMITIAETPIFAVVRSLLAFRLAGANKDYLMIGSDSGKITIAEFDPNLNDWKTIHCETFGKTGCRRIVPGQYLAADPKGRAILIGAVEKQKFVYVMNRDSANRLTISSPLEAHKNDCILFYVVGIDVGFDNPIFGMIELEYTEADQDHTGEAAVDSEKRLTYYELDLGLNHVVRKWSEPISRTANMLLTVPGGDDGPSGVLICGESWISYKHQGHVEVRTALPRRRDMPQERGLLITAATMYRKKDFFFFLLQSELGDLYKVTLDIDSSQPKIVKSVIVSVFDTIQPVNNLSISKTGMLFAASEFGNHTLFHFQGLGDQDDVVRSISITDEALNEELGDDSVSASRVADTFIPSARLRNLALADEIESLAAVTDMIVDDIAGEGTPQIHTLCGRGNRSSLRVLRHGVSVTEMAVSELPGRPSAIWTVKEKFTDEFDKFIVVSFTNATLVLSIGENVEEVPDSGFLASVPTIEVVVLADDALLQVHATGIRHIRSDKRVSEWKTPGRKQIEKASANSRQVAISLAGGEVVYFELDAAGQLMETKTLDLQQEVSCLDIGEIPDGSARASFLVLGCWDDTIQLLSLDPADLLVTRSTMKLSARAESVCLVRTDKKSATGVVVSGATASTSADSTASMYLSIGLVNGVLCRVAVDATAGNLSDSRQRYLGPRSVKLFRVQVRGSRGVLALSSRPWLLYNYQDRYFQAPMSYETLEHAANFSSELCAEGIVAIAGNTLRIVTVDNLGAMFNQTVYPLRYTPRRMCRIPDSNLIVIVETDHNEYNESEQAARVSSVQSGAHTVVPDSDTCGDEADTDLTIPIRGPLPPCEGKWASCLRVMEPGTGNILECLELSDNEAAFSVSICKFSHREGESFVVVGTAKDLTLHPRRSTACFLHVYRLLDGRLQLLHKTDVEEIPLAMCEFHGRLLVGVGRSLRLYELGKKRLLRKCENKTFPTMIVKIQTHGDRVYVGDMTESVHFVKYKRVENSLVIFADDTLPRYISFCITAALSDCVSLPLRFTTSLVSLDYDTVGGSDKFGNVFVLQTPDNVNDNVEASTGQRMLWDQGVLNGAPSKLDQLTHYHLGEAVTAMTKCSLVPGGRDAIIAATIMGGLYAFVPMLSKEDVEFFQHLEMYMRQEWPNLCRRDHLSYR